MRGEIIDPTESFITDEYGIPLSITHHPQTDLPVWQFIHKLAIPVPNCKNADRPYTHICILCAAVPPIRSTGKKVLTWKNALMRQRMSTNAVAHMRRVHPEECSTLANSTPRKRKIVLEKADIEHKTARAPVSKKRVPRSLNLKKQAKKAQNDDEDGLALGGAAQKRNTDQTIACIKNWMMSSDLRASILQDRAFLQVFRHFSAKMPLFPTIVDLNHHVQDEFDKFCTLLRTHLTTELQLAMGLPFVSLRSELRPMTRHLLDETVEKKGVYNHKTALFSLAIGFLDSQWQRNDFVLAVKEVACDWKERREQLVAQTIGKMYKVESITNYVRFHVAVDDELSLTFTAAGEYERPTEEDLLTRLLRCCVIDALGVGPNSAFGGETNVRRILRLLQELVIFFELPDIDHGSAEVCSSAHKSVYLASSTEDLALSTTTSFGAIVNLIKISCARYPMYWSYFKSAVRLTATKPQLEEAWTQLTTEDWQTVTEIEALLSHLGQFRLEDHVASQLGAVTSSYAMLFRRLLSVTINASSLKCYCFDEFTIALSPSKNAMRRKAKRVDTFTPSGEQCILHLRQLIEENFASPSTPLAVDDEIKAMLLDPRISSKAANLVTDSHTFHRAQEALRQEHRVAFELLAARQGNASSSANDEVEEDEEDDEISALLMVDGPKNQPPSAPSTTTSGRRPSDTVAVDEARAWQEWQKVYVAWDTFTHDGANLFDKGQYNLLKLYYHVDILKWFRDVGQQAHPVASLLARVYLSQQPPPFRTLGASLLRFTMQEESACIIGAAQRAEKRCILHQNWYPYQHLSAKTTLVAASSNESGNTSSL